MKDTPEKCVIGSKLTVTAPEWQRSDFFTVHFE